MTDREEAAGWPAERPPISSSSSEVLPIVFDGQYLLSNVLEALLAQQESDRKHNEILAAQRALMDRLRNPGTGIRYRSVEDIPEELYAELARTSLAIHITEGEPRPNIIRSNVAVAELYRDHYQGRQAFLKVLEPDYAAISLESDGRYMRPTNKHSLEGKLVATPGMQLSPEQIRVKGRVSRYLVSLFNTYDARPLVGIDMLD